MIAIAKSGNGVGPLWSRFLKSGYMYLSPSMRTWVSKPSQMWANTCWRMIPGMTYGLGRQSV